MLVQRSPWEGFARDDAGQFVDDNSARHEDWQLFSSSSQPSGSARRGESSDNRSNRASHLLGLHFLGLAGLPGASWLERPPEYELIIQSADAAKRLRPRLPAPPVAASAGGVLDEEELKALLPGDGSGVAVLRIDERTAIRLAEPAAYVYVDVWEERKGLLDFGSKVPDRRHLGQCYVPLEQRFNKRACTWSIVSKDGGGSSEVGYLTCRFSMARTPPPVQNLRVVTGSARANELNLVWDPPSADGGMPLRGYRIEAREPQHGGRISAGGMPGYLVDEPRTASAPASKEPTASLKNLIGNTAYTIRVWAVNEAGPGLAAEVMGQTGAVPPGVCSPVRAASDCTDQTSLSVEWNPSMETGGAAVVAYRVWLRPVFQDGLGNFFPADDFIDLGLFEHRGGAAAVQTAPIRLDQMPSCSGCLCSIAAINAAGLTGPSTTEAPVVWASNKEREKEIFELATSPVPTDMGAGRVSSAVPAATVRVQEMVGSFSASVMSQNDRQELPKVRVTQASETSGQVQAWQNFQKQPDMVEPVVQRRRSAPSTAQDPSRAGWWAETATPARAGAGPAAQRGSVATASAVAANAAAAIDALDRSTPAWQVSTRGSLMARAPYKHAH